MKKLVLVPCDLDEANAFVIRVHRHHGKATGHKFSLAAYSSDRDCIVGVAIVGRPVARMLDNGLTLELLRVATDGTRNACSFLYGAVRRAAFSLGYKRVITYVLGTESGVSLLASGWKCIGLAGGGTWSRKSRPRVDKHPAQKKIRWEVAVEG